MKRFDTGSRQRIALTQSDTRVEPVRWRIRGEIVDWPMKERYKFVETLHRASRKGLRFVPTRGGYVEHFGSYDFKVG